MVVVNCEVCRKEIRIAPGRFKKNKHHTCSKSCLGVLSSKIHSTKVSVKCKICNSDIKLKPSHAKKIKNPTCSRACVSKWRSAFNRGSNNPNYKDLTSIEKVFFTRASNIALRAKTKGLECDIDYKDLLALYNSQKGLCFYSDIPLKMPYKGNSKKTYDTMSVDRLDSSKGYVKGNIVLCLYSINMFKSDHSMEDLKFMFKSIMIKEQRDLEVKVKRLYPDSQVMTKSDPLASGYDLFTHRYEETEHFVKVYTGIALKPDSGYWFMLAPRSSSYKKGLTLYNNLGIIDQNYTGEIIGVFLKTPEYKGISVGERLLQLIPQRALSFTINEVSELENTDRGSKGFGSSGN